MDLVRVYWFNGTPNFGDGLAPVLVRGLFGLEVKWASWWTSAGRRYHLTIGSVIKGMRPGAVVWGSGAIQRGMTFPHKPDRVCAVRGPMTRAALLNSGIECPEVYGDPALLLPRFHNRGVEKKYSLGVVPHYVDKNHPWVRAARRRGVHIIDVQQENPLDVVDDIRRCRAIASSSLHGLVVADAYGIPSAQLVLTGRVWGGQFKFNDYFLSVGRPRHQPLRVSQWTTLAAVKTRAEKGPEISIDLDVLLAAAPFGGPHA